MRQDRGRRDRPRKRASSLAVLAGAWLLAGFGPGEEARGNRLFLEGRYAEAVEAYRDALADGETPRLHYNLGTALLRLGRHDEAERHLRAALGNVEPELRQRTHYNLGSRFLEAALATPAPEERRPLLEGAVEAYRQALRLDPDDVDAKWNLEMALEQQEELPPAPAGGGGEDPDEGQDADSEADPQGDPQPSPSSSAGDRRDQGAPAPGDLTQEQAERILSAVEQDERELYQEKLRSGRRERPVLRNW